MKTLRVAFSEKFGKQSLKNLDKSLKSTVSVIRQGNYALYEGYSTMETVAEWHDCSITDAKFIVNYRDIAFTFPKGSSYRELFDQTLQKMIESGELDRIKKSYAPRKPNCDGSKGTTLGLKTTCFAVAVFLLGIVACGTIWIIEIIKQFM